MDIGLFHCLYSDLQQSICVLLQDHEDNSPQTPGIFPGARVAALFQSKL